MLCLVKIYEDEQVVILQVDDVVGTDAGRHRFNNFTSLQSIVVACSGTNSILWVRVFSVSERMEAIPVLVVFLLGARGKTRYTKHH